MPALVAVLVYWFRVLRRPMDVRLKRRHVGGSAVLILGAGMIVLWVQERPMTLPGRYEWGELAGVMAVYLFTWSLLLATRARWLEPWFGGLDRMYLWHKRAAIAGPAGEHGRPCVGRDIASWDNRPGCDLAAACCADSAPLLLSVEIPAPPDGTVRGGQRRPRPGPGSGHRILTRAAGRFPHCRDCRIPLLSLRRTPDAPPAADRGLHRDERHPPSRTRRRAAPHAERARHHTSARAIRVPARRHRRHLARTSLLGRRHRSRPSAAAVGTRAGARNTTPVRRADTRPARDSQRSLRHVRLHPRWPRSSLDRRRHRCRPIPQLAAGAHIRGSAQRGALLHRPNRSRCRIPA